MTSPTPAEAAAAQVRARIVQVLAGELPASDAAVIDGWADALASIALAVEDDRSLTAQMPAEHRERFGYECGNVLRVVPGTVAKLDTGCYILTTE